MKAFTFILGAALAGTAVVHAASVGSQAAPWLLLNDSARTAAMGGASVALADDVNTVSTNPAGLGNLGTQQLALTHISDVQNTYLEHVAYGAGAPGYGGIAAAFNYMNYGSIAAYEISNNQLVPNGTIDPYGMDVEVGYGDAVGPVSAGLGLKVVTEDLSDGSQSTLGADAGVLWREDPHAGLSAGAAVQNLGGQLEGANLATNLQAGLAYRMPLATGAQGFTLAGDYSVPTAEPATDTLALGLEFAGDTYWAIRGGYRYVGNNGISGLSVGGGLVYQVLRIDYAFVSEGVLGDSNDFSLTASF